MSRLPWIGLAVCLVSAVGCGTARQWWHNGLKVGPNYCPPPTPAASTWIDSESETFTIGENDTSFWWQTFADPTLDRLIHVAYQQNRSLRTAGLRVLEARQKRASAVGNLFPQSQVGDGSFTHSKSSSNSGTTFPGIPLQRDAWALGFSLAWEVDFWGRFRREVEAADASLQSSMEDYDFLLTTLIADVATTYAQLRSLEQRLSYAQQNVQIQKDTLETTITKERLGARGVTGLEVNQARSNFSQTLGLVPQLELSRRQLQNALAVLLGVPPSDLVGAFQEGAIPTAPDQIVVDVPANLMRRRPDIRRNERRLAAQSARIGIAVADLLPQLTLNGSLSLEATEFEELFSSASQAGFVSPGFRWNLLNYGRLRNNVRVQQTSYLQLVSDYENSVLAAQREVEDAMAAFLYAKQRTRHLREAALAAQEAVRLGKLQWQAGKIAFNQVFVLESSLTTAQDALVSAELDVAVAIIDMYRAMGGGWQLRTQVPYVGDAHVGPHDVSVSQSEVPGRPQRQASGTSSAQTHSIEIPGG